MQYLCLLYDAEKDAPQPGTDAFGAMMQGYMSFTETVKNGGQMVAGDALESVETATTVTVRGGKTTATDGPFAETKEQLGGYYLLECKDLDEAIALAAQIPAAETGRVEIRPVMVFN